MSIWSLWSWFFNNDKFIWTIDENKQQKRFALSSPIFSCSVAPPFLESVTVFRHHNYWTRKDCELISGLFYFNVGRVQEQCFINFIIGVVITVIDSNDFPRNHAVSGLFFKIALATRLGAPIKKNSWGLF